MEYGIEQYGKKPAFSSFLPGIAGAHGIPVWCYYVNRGQGVISFGVEGKDHPIMEFLPAHRAYTRVRLTGFRTFLRVDGQYEELFVEEDRGRMSIGMNTLHIEDRGQTIRADVDYYVLPEAPVGALVRRVRLTNQTEQALHLEVLDGMPEVVPYGISDWTLKNMLQTGKAWMQAEDTETKVPYFRTRASTEDTADITMIEGGNFAAAFTADGEKLPVVTDPQTIFDYDLSMERPIVFAREGLAGVQTRKAQMSNLFPCAFFLVETQLQPGESVCWNEIIGQVSEHGILDRFLEGRFDAAWFEEKYARAVALTEELTDCIDTRTKDPIFDAYCRYTYMDNVLRGGRPIVLGDKIFYTYSRKHGDLERDYNAFSMLPEYYSQGNGNFRDVDQNRRSDTFFSPYVGRYNLHTFYDMIQLDGYNPLHVEMQTFVPEGETEALTPGQIFARLEGRGEADRFEDVMRKAKGHLNAKFSEGFWSDHWTYNLDLVEEYLAIWPDQEKDLLYTPEYTWFPAQAMVAPRARRYEETDRGIRQYHSLERIRESQGLYVQDAAGQTVYSTLLEKLSALCAVKFAALDPYGMGMEMESGRPGWYDALNGLPGLLGSAMTETYELKRMLDFTIEKLQKYEGVVRLPQETAGLLQELVQITEAQAETLQKPGEQIAFWNAINDAKEAYREAVFDGIRGERCNEDAAGLAQKLSVLRDAVDTGIRKAEIVGTAAGNEVVPTYFYYEVTEYTKDAEGIHPQHFAVHPLPPFLEGPVRRMKTAGSDAKAIYEAVRRSELFDRKLSMYRVNASLDKESFELGRCRAFTPGWLENASIWLHMEYKYLLETLKAGLYPEFLEDLRSTCVPFLDPEVYGRSPLENSSFLASSLNPNEEVHGRGFVARLSGSTAEFLSIWRRMLFGEQPFAVEQGELVCRLLPVIPSWLIPDDQTVQARFLGRTPVTYELEDKADHIPGNYRVHEVRILAADGSEQTVEEIRGAQAEALRDGRLQAVTVRLGR